MKLSRDRFIELLKMGKNRKEIMEEYDIKYDELHRLTKQWNLIGWKPNKGEPPQPKKKMTHLEYVSTDNFIQALEDTAEVDEPIVYKQQVKVWYPKSEEPKEKYQTQPNVIEHPPHYTAGKVECIDAIESAVMGLDPDEAVHVANVMKYIWRFKRKNGLQDLRKAEWYLKRLIERQESR